MDGMVNVEEMGFKEIGPRPVGRGRRAGVILLSIILAVVACAFVSLAFIQGSWWHAYETDQALNDESCARVKAIRDEVDTAGTAPEAAVWLDASLETGVHPSDARAYLMTAQDALKATGVPELAEAAAELNAIIETIRPAVKQPSYLEATSTTYSAPTSEWPQWED